jgi:hypothetical protein
MIWPGVSSLWGWCRPPASPPTPISYAAGPVSSSRGCFRAGSRRRRAGRVARAGTVSRSGACAVRGCGSPSPVAVRRPAHLGVPPLGEVCLPRLAQAASGVPGVQADEVVPDERDLHEQAGRHQSGHPEEASVDVEGLVPDGSEEAFDAAAAVIRLRPAGALPREGLPVALVLGVLDGDGLAASARLALDAAGGGGERVRLPPDAI